MYLEAINARYTVEVQQYYRCYLAPCQPVALVSTCEEVMQVLANIATDYPVGCINPDFTMPLFNNDCILAEVQVQPGDNRTIVVNRICDPDLNYLKNLSYNL